MEEYLKKYQASKSNMKTKKISRKEKQQLIIDSLNNPENPYSTVWSNKILKINYNVGLEVKGFQNGIPTFKIKRLKDEPNLLPIYNMTQSKYGRFGDSDEIYSSSNNKQEEEKKSKKSKKGKKSKKDKKPL